jgi:aspartate kinase
VVSLGELASSRILTAALAADGQNAEWLDARTVVRTDAVYRRATVDWTATAEAAARALAAPAAVTVTQGFIGSAPDGSTTTLGREGSDYSAAIFANVLKASSLSIWKDVPGMLSGDPKVFSGVVRLEQVPYREAIELAFYGASIIHPKTIQPLEQGGTTLRIRSFVDPESPGTEVGPFQTLKPEVPCWIRHENQVLIEVSSRDLRGAPQRGLPNFRRRRPAGARRAAHGAVDALRRERRPSGGSAGPRAPQRPLPRHGRTRASPDHRTPTRRRRRGHAARWGGAAHGVTKS